jgi:hypothetical protein
MKSRNQAPRSRKPQPIAQRLGEPAARIEQQEKRKEGAAKADSILISRMFVICAALNQQVNAAGNL